MARTPRMARWLADYPDPFIMISQGSPLGFYCIVNLYANVGLLTRIIN